MHRATRRPLRKYGLGILAGMMVLALSFVIQGENIDRPRLIEVANGLSFLIPLILIPGLIILLGIEVTSYIKQRKRGNLGKVLLRIFVGSWLVNAASLLLVYGAACVIGGIERILRMVAMKDLGAGVATLVSGLVLGGAGWLSGWWAFRRKADPAEAREIALAAEQKSAWEQLDFAALEQQLGCTLPAAYKAMMQPSSEWREKAWTLHPHRAAWFNVTALVPPHPNALRKSPATPETMLCFARGDDFEYWLRLGDEDPPVYAHYPDETGETTEEIAPKLSVFLAWRKTEYT